MIVGIILLIIALVVFIKFYNKYKAPKIGAIAFFDGSVKTCKSGVSVGVAIKTYKKNLFRWRISCFFVKLLNSFRKNKYDLPERPLLYSNIPLAEVDFIPLRQEHILRQVRLSKRAVVLVDEASLLADSSLIKDNELNKQMLLFFKLYGHSTHGGTIIVNSQQIADVHFSLKRCIGQYFYIHHVSKYIPFFVAVSMREERYSDDGAIVNNYDKDIEESMKIYLLPKRTFKKYDSYCFSHFTDHLPFDTFEDTIKLSKYDSLKAKNIVSFRKDFNELKGD